MSFQVPQFGIHGFKIDNGKPPVGRVGEKRQNMECIDGPFKVSVAEIGQHGQGRLSFSADEIPVGDQDHVFFSEPVPGIVLSFIFYQLRRLMGAIDVEDSLQFGHIGPGSLFPVQKNELF